MRDTSNIELLKIREAVNRARDNGMPVSEYTVRRAVRSGQLPCLIVGKTYLLTWTNFMNWITCADKTENAAASGQKTNPRK